MSKKLSDIIDVKITHVESVEANRNVVMGDVITYNDIVYDVKCEIVRTSEKKLQAKEATIEAKCKVCGRWLDVNYYCADCYEVLPMSKCLPGPEPSEPEWE